MPLTTEDIEQIAKRTAQEVMDKIGERERDTLLLHSIPYAYGSPGIVVNEALAKATPCRCIEYRPGKKLCFSKGIVGALSNEQERNYCPTVEGLESPGLKKRLEGWMESVETCKTEIAETPKGERLEPWLSCMSRELSTHETHHSPRNPQQIAYVEKLPKCDFCDKLALYDGRTTMGPWAHMCEEHFRTHGVGLGVGKGQKLVARKALVEAEKIRMPEYEEQSVTMTADDLETATFEDLWYPICPYCGAETPAEPDAHAVYCQACNRRFKIINPFFSSSGSTVKFPLGQTVMTRGVADRVAVDSAFAAFVVESLKRHASGDWGDLCEEDKRENEFALGRRLRLFSAYEKKNLPKIWIITEADRSVTTTLFPEEY